MEIEAPYAERVGADLVLDKHQIFLSLHVVDTAGRFVSTALPCAPRQRRTPRRASAARRASPPLDARNARVSTPPSDAFSAAA
eukprot:40683-Pleurochrysis_carterae.AAC.1